MDQRPICPGGRDERETTPTRSVFDKYKTRAKSSAGLKQSFTHMLPSLKSNRAKSFSKMVDIVNVAVGCGSCKQELGGRRKARTQPKVLENIARPSR